MITNTVEPIRTKGADNKKLKVSFESKILFIDNGKLLSKKIFCPSKEIEDEVGIPIPKLNDEKHIYIIEKSSVGNEVESPYPSLAPKPILIASMITIIGPISPFTK